jgi:hypothetical protein
MQLPVTSTSPSVKNFELHDESRRATLALGPSFVMCGLDTGVDSIKAQLQHMDKNKNTWKHSTPLFCMSLSTQLQKNFQWVIGGEKKYHPTNAYRAFAKNVATDTMYALQVDENLHIETAVPDMSEYMPESAFGALIGAAAGMTDVQKLLYDADNSVAGNVAEPQRSDWRAPRFCFTLQTASGSPFVEKWAFAIQESTLRSQRFRVWIEQQRTGREIQLLLRDDGTIEGIHDIETLPAAIHGAGLGMLMGINHVLHDMKTLDSNIGNPLQQSIVAFDEMPDEALSDEQAEALLEQYVAQIRKRRNVVKDS